MAVSLSSSDKEVIERSVDVSDIDADLSVGVTDANLEDVFEIDRCLKWASEKRLEKVTLQFPDSLLSYAPNVAGILQKKSGMRFAILGDTSYGDCCVDEVAAEHLGSDGVIHFGNTCLTPTQRLPVLFVFTAMKLDTDSLSAALNKITDEHPHSRIHVFYDVRYHSAMSRSGLTNAHKEANFCAPPTEPSLDSRCGRRVEGELKESDVVLYCGNSDKYALLLALTFNRFKQITYDPKTKSTSKTFENIGRLLMQRTYLIEKAKDASRIGLLVGTLGVSRYRDIIDRVLDAVKASGKKAYTFLVGKPNVPKLANFPEIDVFVLIACPENSIVGAKEFMQPVITPFELDVALNSARNWTGDFAADFRDILPGSTSFKKFVQDMESDVSLVTGKMRTANVSGDEGDSSSQAVMRQETTVSVLHRGGGGEFLSERSWRGLEQNLGQTEVAKAVKGKGGIPMGYEGEGAE